MQRLEPSTTKGYLPNISDWSSPKTYYYLINKLSEIKPKIATKNAKMSNPRHQLGGYKNYLKILAAYYWLFSSFSIKSLISSSSSLDGSLFPKACITNFMADPLNVLSTKVFSSID